MKILCPITSAEDIRVLEPAKYGTEFFCGYLPTWWREKYNHIESVYQAAILSTPLNNRNSVSANVLTLDELRRIVAEADDASTNVYLTLNAKYYPEYVYNDIERYVSEVEEIGIRRIIVCDIGMIAFLEERFPTLKISISCLNQVTNSGAVGFYRRFKNVERIVFPRHMSVQEISSISAKYPDLEFEYFIFSNRCLYDDGYCRSVHEFTPICKDIFWGEYYGTNGIPLEEPLIRKLQKKEADFRSWTQNANHAVLRGYCTPGFACSACSLIDLISVPNITSVKMSIRGHDIQERLRQVRMARAAIDTAVSTKNIESIKAIISREYGKPDLCDDGMACMMK